MLELLTTSEADNEELAESVKTVPKFCATLWSATISTLSAPLAKYDTA